MTVDQTDRELLARLQEDATQSYAALGQAVGLSAGAAHERVRKLKAAGVIRRTTAEVDPAALGAGVLAYVLLDQYSDSRGAGVLLRTATRGDVINTLSLLKPA